MTVATTGSDLDPDGYTVLPDGGAARASAPDNTTGIIFPDLTAGMHTVVLTGLAANCTTSGQDTVTVSVEQDSTAWASFAACCVAFGAVHVTATVSGVDPDPGGYTVSGRACVGRPAVRSGLPTAGRSCSSAASSPSSMPMAAASRC